MPKFPAGRTILFATLLSSMLATNGIPSYADAISPGIRSNGQVYSKESPDASFYGTGVAGRMSEAMELRFEGERATQDGKLDLAIRKLSKAVQLDPGCPDSHLLLARALSAKFSQSANIRFTKKWQPLDQSLLDSCLDEWKLIKLHDADTINQDEAKREYRRISRLAKAYTKQQNQKTRKPLDSVATNEYDFH